MATALISKLPLAESFEPTYLEYYGILPLELDGEHLKVATDRAPAAEILEDLELSYGMPLELVPVSQDELLDGIRRTFAASESVVELVRDLDAEFVSAADGPDDVLADARHLANQPPVIRFVNLLIREAHDARASDIHLEASREGLRVRFRVDGVLTELPSPPKGLQAAVVSRVKLLAELDIAERRAPQDGRIRVRLEERELDLRVSTVPTLYGESVVLRLLDRGGRPVALDELGMAHETLERFRRFAARPHGILLATGPTGSGKTTTLYAALGLRQRSAEKIITVEDPVEYHLEGVTQVPVNVKAGMTFGSALRSILRQDPDVLMVGEMRDAETAGIAVQAAMTGHLVFSTLHTNDAASAVTRLLELGAPTYLLNSTILGVMAQRLVRTLCRHCKEKTPYEGAREGELSWEEFVAPWKAKRPAHVYRQVGCLECRNTGYLGRIGLYKILLLSPEIKRLVNAEADVAKIRELAYKEGMKPLRISGAMKVAMGLTTLGEVLKVAPPPGQA